MEIDPRFVVRMRCAGRDQSRRASRKRSLSLLPFCANELTVGWVRGERRLNSSCSVWMLIADEHYIYLPLPLSLQSINAAAADKSITMISIRWLQWRLCPCSTQVNWHINRCFGGKASWTSLFTDMKIATPVQCLACVRMGASQFLRHVRRGGAVC